MKTIIKIQRPLFTNTEPEVLMYNETRSFEATYPLTKELEKVFGDDVKQYWLANVPKRKGQVELLEEVEWQDW